MLLNWQFKQGFIEKVERSKSVKGHLSSRKRLFLDPVETHLLTQVHEQKF
ncbi:hypothetical protein SAMN05428975_0699 [Mucilaginibacter sp. OK268]|jgi:hypothetical protein|nr:hypothetical protein [Mucilaginibacter sp. OK268]SDP20739.1 hypothetical protein SAMN05428975_0699 [Mucilaginibacter sp. OK268]